MCCDGLSGTVKDVFHSSSRWFLLETNKQSLNIPPRFRNLDSRKTQNTTTTTTAAANNNYNDKPHVQSIEEEDTVACSQSTFLSRTIWGDKMAGNQEIEKGILAPPHRITRCSEQTGQSRERWWLMWRCQSDIQQEPINKQDDLHDKFLLRKETVLSKQSQWNLFWLHCTRPTSPPHLSIFLTLPVVSLFFLPKVLI